MENYTRVNWQDSPSAATPLSAENLNKMDLALYEMNQALKKVIEVPIIINLSDQTTALTVGTSKATFRMPFACNLTTTLPKASVNTVSSSGVVTVDINKSGVSVLTNKLTIDVNEKTSKDATTPCSLVNTPTTFTDDEEITFDIDVAGTGAKWLVVTLYVERI